MPHAPDLDAMLRAADAALIIGDPALRLDPARLPYEVHDLGGGMGGDDRVADGVRGLGGARGGGDAGGGGGVPRVVPLRPGAHGRDCGGGIAPRGDSRPNWCANT